MCRLCVGCVLLVFRLCEQAAEYAIMRMYGHITKMMFYRLVWLHISKVLNLTSDTYNK